MPVIAHSTYCPPRLYRNPHVQTIYPLVMRKVRGIRYTRERMVTPDSDFIDLDWSTVDSSRLVIVTHGLEGSARSKYVRGFARAANNAGWDVLAWNLRGCSGEPNNRLQTYHSGASDDLQLVFSHALFRKKYSEIALVGFSLGGNLTLKFLGEQGESIQSLISGAVCFSVPCDLRTSARRLTRTRNKYYLRYFMKPLQKKIALKQAQYPEYLPPKNPALLKDFTAFDNYYTAPVHGFRNATEYWYQNSSRRFLNDIRIPTLLVNALDDPFLSPGCFPYKQAESNPFVTLETPSHGGHVGFIEFNKEGIYWSERRGMEFLEQHSLKNLSETEGGTLQTGSVTGSAVIGEINACNS